MLNTDSETRGARDKGESYSPGLHAQRLSESVFGILETLNLFLGQHTII